MQHLRDELRFSLQKERGSLAWVLQELTREEWHQLEFFRGVGGSVGIVTNTGGTVTLPRRSDGSSRDPRRASSFMEAVRKQWTTRRLSIDGLPGLISDAAVLAGAPVIDGTRVETAFVANLALELSRSEIRALFPNVPEGAIEHAAEFEGVMLHAA